ncbi:MAG: hypothetical protein AAFY71_06445 [Bacteroidota bacterium]
MKNNRICPKCRSQEILVTKRSGGAGLMLPVWPYKTIPTIVLACTSCGYCEEWIQDTNQLKNARDYKKTYREKLMAYRQKIGL